MSQYSEYSVALLAAGGAGVEMQAPRRQVGVAVAPALCLLLPRTMYRILPYLHHETRISTLHFPLSGDTTTTHTCLLIGTHPKKTHLCVFHPTTRFLTPPPTAIRVKPILSTPPPKIASTTYYYYYPFQLLTGCKALLHEPCFNATSVSQPHGVADRSMMNLCLIQPLLGSPHGIGSQSSAQPACTTCQVCEVASVRLSVRPCLPILLLEYR